MNQKTNFEELKTIIAQLRDPKTGCPWDLKQTHKSLYPLMIDEAYEVVEAIEKEDFANLKEELGDLLLHIMLQSQVAMDGGSFNIEEVIEGLKEKLIRRHPHVFGDIEVKNVQEVVDNWKAIKEKEGKKEGKKEEKISSIIPSLVQAFRLLHKNSNLQLSKKEALENLREQMASLEEKDLSTSKGKETMGHLFFQMSTLAFAFKIHPEEVMREKMQKILKELSPKKNLG